MINPYQKLCASLLVYLLIFIAQPVQAKNIAADTDDVKVLFIGNSYTYWVENILQFMLDRVPDNESVFEFYTRGATPLAYFAEDVDALHKIKTGEFDYVVLQEWSRGVGRGGESAQQFENSVSILSKAIRASGAQPLLYMTWGRDDSDGYGSYEDMNRKIAEGYEEAGERYKIPVLPVGRVWGAIRAEDEKLGLSLYEDEIGHPSMKGQIVVASVMFRALFNDVLAWDYTVSDVLSESEWNQVKSATEKFTAALTLETVVAE